MNTSNTPSTHEQETQFVHTQLLSLMSTQKMIMLWGVVIVSIVLAVIGYQPELLWYWVGWLILVALGLVAHYVIRSTPIPHDNATATQKLLRRNVWLEWVNGVTQALCLLAFPYLSDNERQLYTLIFLCIAVGNITNTAGHTQLYWAFTAPIVALLAFVWLWHPDQGSSLLRYLTGSLILIPFTPMMWVFSQSTWALFDESCRLRFREHGLNTQLQQALSEAEQANRAKNRFLASASHDLRQPLHVIGLIGSALKLRVLDDKSVEMVNVLNNATNSLQLLLNSLLDVSKLDAGLLEVQADATSIRLVVEDFYQAYAPLVLTKGLKPRLNLSTDSNEPFWTMTDAVLLLRILNNLGQNALKFTHNGEITLAVYSSTSDIVIEIQDTGCGIAPIHHEDIFQEFFQVGNQERDISQGLGLGLSIVRRIADLLNIQLTLNSVEGQGTLVRLRVPMVPVNHEHKRIEQSQQQATGLRVLVIDDEVNVLEATRLLLEQLGCKCFAVANIEAARLCIQGMLPLRPDVMLVDFRLKGEYNGIDVIRILRQEMGEPLVNAVIVSGDTAPNQLWLAKNAGVKIYHKPLTLEKLNDALSTVSPTA